MYEERLGTDWESLDREEAFHRAYAHGVADVVDSAPEGELDRVRGQVSGRYDESMVELAYDEGVAEARGLRADPDEGDPWGSLVEGETDVTEQVAPPGPERAPKQTDRPTAMDLPELVGRSRDELEKFDLPAFLR